MSEKLSLMNSLKQMAKQIKMNIPVIFLAFRFKETPMLAKVFASITICYALSPVDLIPDFIPILGYLDDIILLPLLITLTIKFIPAKVYTKLREEAKKSLKMSNIKKWYFGIPIYATWILCLYFVINYLLN